MSRGSRVMALVNLSIEPKLIPASARTAALYYYYALSLDDFLFTHGLIRSVLLLPKVFTGVTYLEAMWMASIGRRANASYCTVHRHRTSWFLGLAV